MIKSILSVRSSLPKKSSQNLTSLTASMYPGSLQREESGFLLVLSKHQFKEKMINLQGKQICQESFPSSVNHNYPMGCDLVKPTVVFLNVKSEDVMKQNYKD